MKKMFKNLFSKRNIIKIFTIFCFGIITRTFVNDFFEINVFTDFLSYISITYYLLFALFIAFIHELVDNIMPTITPFNINGSSSSRSKAGLKSSKEYISHNKQSNSSKSLSTQVEPNNSKHTKSRTLSNHGKRSITDTIDKNKDKGKLVNPNDTSSNNYKVKSRLNKSQVSTAYSHDDYIAAKAFKERWENRTSPNTNFTPDSVTFGVDYSNSSDSVYIVSPVESYNGYTQTFLDSNLIRPVSPKLKNLDTPRIPNTPKMSNLSTPSESFTPLFPSTENLNNHNTNLDGPNNKEKVVDTASVRSSIPEVCSVYSNSTNHATLGNPRNSRGSVYLPRDLSRRSPLGSSPTIYTPGYFYNVYGQAVNTSNQGTANCAVDSRSIISYSSNLRDAAYSSRNISSVYTANYPSGLVTSPEHYNSGYGNNTVSMYNTDYTRSRTRPTVNISRYIDPNMFLSSTPSIRRVRTTEQITETIANLSVRDESELFRDTQDTFRYPERRHLVNTRVAEELVGYSSKEVVVEVKKIGFRGRLKLEFRFLNDVKQIYLHYRDVYKRHMCWVLFEEGKDNYRTYEEFKQNFDPNTRVWKKIKETLRTDVSKEVRKLLNTDPFGTGKHIGVNNIKHIGPNSIQDQLNRLHANRYKAEDIDYNRRNRHGRHRKRN